jgi:hypothetical protein
MLLMDEEVGEGCRCEVIEGEGVSEVLCICSGCESARIISSKQK